MTTLSLNCYILGRDPARMFTVKVLETENVSILKDLIKEKNASTLKDVDALDLDVWKVDLPVSHFPNSFEETILPNNDVLSPLQELSEVFLAPDRQRVHVVIKLPSVNKPGIIRPRFPKLLATLSVRKGTVAALYNKLGVYRFIQVRGTPASGKSTLAQLLRNHIMALEPSTPVIWIDGWPNAVVDNNTWREHLENVKHWDYHKGSVFIFDDAQETYEDTGLWNSLFKPTSDDPSHHRIIIFTSYGSPTRINAGRTSMLIKKQQMVTLVPIDHHDGLGAVGLYLTRPEFDEVVNLATKCYLDPACLDLIFKISSGHMGAVKEVIKVITGDNSYRNITASRNLYTISDFFQHFTPHRLYAGLQGAFRSGVPDDDVLQIPAVVHVLRTVLCNNVIVDTGDTMFSEAERVALKRCFTQGWLHADKISNNEEITGYSFASPLHRLYTEWKLSNRNTAITIQPPDLLDFAIQVIKSFSPLNLSRPRIICPYNNQTFPEAQYQDEFYRCCYELTAGSLTTLSEFGTVDGHVEIYIPSKKWAIQLLRDEQLLEQHVNCFSSSGAMSLDIDEYVVLDFRRKKDVQSHPYIEHLFHVVFSDSDDEFDNVAILDKDCWTFEKFGLHLKYLYFILTNIITCDEDG